MCFLVAALALGIALLIGALIAPHPTDRRGFGIEPWAQETNPIQPGHLEMKRRTTARTVGQSAT